MSDRDNSVIDASVSPTVNGVAAAPARGRRGKSAKNSKASKPQKQDRERHTEAAAETDDNQNSRPTEIFANWNFPKNSLEESIRVAQALEEKFAGKPTPSEELCKAVGFKKVKDWRWKNLLRSANMYGLVRGTGTTATVEMEQTGADIVAPKSIDQRRKALLQAFSNVDLFKKVGDHYEGKQIPDDEFFTNTLVREFGIVRDRVNVFIEVFKTNRQYVGAFRSPQLRTESSGTDALTIPAAGHPSDGNQATSQTREFLDTCFVLMPFGHPYDRCYEEVYKQAVKDAGFEPFRADGLFNSGTVIEQIWEQIVKAKVLLAEVTGKNANVFYELGLSHAIGKPVILISSNLDDVPFDLRHLRVIIYDVTDPYWGEKLRKHIGEYVKSAKKEPGKSVPQPFRDLVKAKP